MGCRAFLSPWYERGGMEPADENDVPVFVGRFNIGAVSLHLPMILAKSRAENRDFYEVLDFYLEMIRGLHKRTYDYLGEMRASTNPYFVILMIKLPYTKKRMVFYMQFTERRQRAFVVFR